MQPPPMPTLATCVYLLQMTCFHMLIAATFNRVFFLSAVAAMSIDPGQQFTWEHSNLEVNKPKNRYANVIAYDHSRVILTPVDGRCQATSSSPLWPFCSACVSLKHTHTDSRGETEKQGKH
ncbi:hypothetical protein PAMP_024971 [Pampus punctatissimus]